MTMSISQNMEHNYKVQSICIYGTIFEVIMREKIDKIYNLKEQMVFMRDNFCAIIIKDIMEIAKKNMVLRRFVDNDVRIAMTKLKPKEKA